MSRRLIFGLAGFGAGFFTFGCFLESYLWKQNVATEHEMFKLKEEVENLPILHQKQKANMGEDKNELILTKYVEESEKNNSIEKL